MFGYGNKVLDYFHNPRNCGDIIQADGIGVSELIDTAIVVRISIRVNGETIQDIKFRCSGCVTAIASASILTELAVGKTIHDYQNISSKTIADALGNVPEEKMHCCNIAADAFHKAVENYRDNSLKT